MYSMKEACAMTGLSYETLKYYCNEGLVPGLQRDGSNRRVFEERQIQWIKGLLCLKDCGMGVLEMKRYIGILLAPEPDIPALKEMLDDKRRELEQTIRQAEESLKFIQWKQTFYNEVLSGERELFEPIAPAEEEYPSKQEETK